MDDKQRKKIEEDILKIMGWTADEADIQWIGASGDVPIVIPKEKQIPQAPEEWPVQEKVLGCEDSVWQWQSKKPEKIIEEALGLFGLTKHQVTIDLKIDTITIIPKTKELYVRACTRTHGVYLPGVVLWGVYDDMINQKLWDKQLEDIRNL